MSQVPLGVVRETACHGEGEPRVKHDQHLVGDTLAALGLLREHTDGVNGGQLVYNWMGGERGRTRNSTVD